MIHTNSIFISILDIEIQNWWHHEMLVDDVHPPYCSSWKKISTIIVDVMLTCGSHFQLECHFQLVIVDYHSFKLQLIDFNYI
jgi:hypothetical protein